ncbi:MAG: LacI family DNA-binding transcriptional regulator [Verrucomicrobiota bacterium]
MSVLDSKYMEIDEHKRVTLSDIAAATGLSKATVCRVVNKSTAVSAETEAKVKKAIQELHYRPDPALSALAKHRWGPVSERMSNYSVALVMVTEPESGKDHDRIKLVEAFDRRVHELQMHSEVFYLNDFKNPATLGRILYSRGFEGILASVAQPMIDWRFPWERFVVVTVGYDHPAHQHHSICSDWAEAVRLTFDNVMKTGAKRPGFVMMNHRHPVLDQIIWDAMLGCCYELRQTRDVDMVPFRIGPREGRGKESARSKFAEWFNDYTPDVVIDSNRIAIWWMKDLGIKVPTDVGYSSLLGPGEADGLSYSGIRHHYDIQCEIALEKILALLQLNRRGPSQFPVRSLLGCGWAEGHSLTKSKE